MVYLLKMVIFYSYVKLPEGKSKPCGCLCPHTFQLFHLGAPDFFRNRGVAWPKKRGQEPLDAMDKGYQPPLDESMVKEFDPEDRWRRWIHRFRVHWEDLDGGS